MEKDTMNIRRMTHADILDVVDFDRKIGKGQSRITYRDLASTDPEGPLDLSFISEIEGKVIGFILARLAYLGIPFAEVCIIHGILVDPDYQRSGVGSKLVSALLSYCRNEGIYTIRALVAEHDNELRKFALQLGFSPSTIVNYDKSLDS
jgi:ribosomal protein S18 acetylase RimI-like enzyme